MQELIAHLLDKQISLEEACEELGISPELTFAQEKELYSSIFQCGLCGTWCELCEANGYTDAAGMICQDCASEETDWKE